MTAETNTTKRAILERLLDEGMVLITLDARADDVRVPAHLADDSQLRLNLSHRFGLPLECTDRGVTATLTFRGSPFDCVLPWRAIYMLISHTTGQPFLFLADVPDDAPNVPGERTGPIVSPDQRSRERGPRLAVVSSESADGVASQADHRESRAGREGSPRNHLRVIK